MKYLIFCGILIIASVATVTAISSDELGITDGARKTNCSCGWTNKNVRRIIGGEEAGLHEFPLIAALVTPKLMIGFCGGTIVTEYHVLSAAHCFGPMKGRPLAVSVGEHDLDRKDETPYTQVIPVAKVIEHAEYNRLAHHNDIALVVLESAIKFNKQVGPACLPYGQWDLVGKKVTVAGWGRTSAEGSGSNLLLKVDLDVVKLDHCLKTYSFLNPNKQICTYTDKKDSCKGDSGGPLLYLNPETNRYTVVGIVSFGKSCASKHGGIWTNVYAYRDWIEQNIAESHPGVRTCS
uniref:Venom s1 protease 17 n=1 Tax=Pristhesancus plagipennis TaxID=1955184 RepID=A0A1Q1NPH0_PRIPG|nr:venom s1 protease 17 [Pristhesancus plagipennis]